MATYIKNSARNKFSSIERVEKKEYYMVSSAQKRMYVLQQMDVQGIAYNIPSMWKLGRHIQPDRFEDIFLKLIHSHESLRTSFHLRGNNPVQVIGEQVDFGIEYFELDSDSAMAGQGEANRTAIQKIIRNFVKKTGTTIYMLLLAIFYIVLSKYTRQEDIIIGSPVTGRRHPDLQEVVGMFVNMLTLRNRPGKNKTFKEFLWEIKNNVLDAIENQDYQFEELVDRLGIERVPGRNPLFDVVFEFQNLDNGSFDDTYLELGSYITENLVSRFDLLMGGKETEDTIRMHLYYSTVLYKKSSAEKIAARFREVLTQVMMDNGIKLKDLRISSDLLEVKSTVFEDDQMEEDFEF